MVDSKPYRGSFVPLRRASLMLNVLVLAIFAAGCCKYDPELHGKLISTKAAIVGTDAANGQPATVGLFDSFTKPEISHDDVDRVRSDVAELVTIAEKNKRWFCSEPIFGAKAIQSHFEDTVQFRINEGPWSETTLANQKQAMDELITSNIHGQESLKE